MLFFLKIQIKCVDKRFAVRGLNTDRGTEADERFNAIRQILCNKAVVDRIRRFYILVDRIARKQFT